MKISTILLLSVLYSSGLLRADKPAPEASLQLPDMPLHDPFILAYQPSHTYYLYTSNRERSSGTAGVGTMVYKSQDLLHWERPKAVFIVPSTAFAQQGAWAPEVHEYKGRYYLFTTLFNDKKPIVGARTNEWFPTYVRGTIVAVSDSPDGPFTMVDEKAALPPADFMTLDGTLYVDPAGQPWLVYAHEWLQRIDGTMEAIPLKSDLSAAAGPPIHLFKASDAPWLNASIHPDTRGLNFVTDGPELFRTSDNHLLMLWSSYESGSYVQTVARSKSGTIAGPWEQLEPIVKQDSGHGMLFRTFEGQLMMVIHRPFRNARGKLYEMADRSDHLEVIRERTDLDGDKPASASSPMGRPVPRPLYRDPVFDAPTDPVLCYNAESNRWLMYYTQRRATVTNAPGVSWVYGSAIGVAESSDGGATWTYVGQANISYGKDKHPTDFTYWAPEVIWDGQQYHMFLAYIPGIFKDWSGSREIVHLTSADGVKWDTVGPVDLKSDKVIDPCVIQLPSGGWRMWYKDERKSRPLSYADSVDLKTWEPKGTAVSDFSGEGPKVFHWKGRYWLIADCWKNGMRVWSSDDCLNWKLQTEPLIGSHGDVVVSGARAWWFYFTNHSGVRTTAIDVVELYVNDGRLIADDPTHPTYIDLKPVREEEK